MGHKNGIGCRWTMLLVLGFTSPQLFGQYTSQQISGFVKDPTGAAVSGATVTVKQTTTQFERSTSTSETGYYVITNIPIGAYEVSAELPGFKRFVKSGVEVTVGSKPTVDIALELGEVRDTVTVVADVATVESSNGEVGRLISGDQASKLQLNGRNFTQLLALVPGVSTT